MFPRAFALASAGRFSQLRAEFSQLLVKAGLRNPEEQYIGRTHSEGEKYLRLSFSSLRHSHVTMLKRTGIPKTIAAQICGHKSSVVSLVYRKTNLHDAVQGLPELPGDGTLG